MGFWKKPETQVEGLIFGLTVLRWYRQPSNPEYTLKGIFSSHVFSISHVHSHFTVLLLLLNIQNVQTINISTINLKKKLLLTSNLWQLKILTEENNFKNIFRAFIFHY